VDNREPARVTTDLNPHNIVPVGVETLGNGLARSQRNLALARAPAGKEKYSTAVGGAAHAAD
jgi:hypothetical protein